MTVYDSSFIPFLRFLLASRESLYAMTLGLCACAGISLFLIWLRTLREQKWLFFFSGAYLLWVAQYIFRWSTTSTTWPQAFSNLNNYFLVLSAVSLLRGLERRVFLRAALWLVPVSATGLLSAYLSKSEYGPILERLPDWITSVATLAVLGFGLAQTIPLGPSRGLLRLVAYTTTSLYSVAEIFYGLSPLFVRAIYDWAIAQGQSISTISIASALDILAFGFTLPLKFGFFLVALYTVTRSLERLHPRAFQQFGARVGKESRPAATVQELAEAFGKVLNADVCEICLRLPGQQRPRILWRAYVMGRVLPAERTSLPSASTSYVGRVLATGRREWEQAIPENSHKYFNRFPNLKWRKSILTVPIELHTTFTTTAGVKIDLEQSSQRPVIGALNVEWCESIRLTETIALQLQQMADQIAPFLQKERELAAIDSLSHRFASIETEHSLSAKPFAVLSRIVLGVQDLLAPDRTELHFKLGFEQLGPVVAHIPHLDSAPLGNYAVASPSYLLEHLTTRLMVAPDRSEETIFSWVQDLGTLDVFVPRTTEAVTDITRPILGTSRFYRGLISSMVVDATLDTYRRSLADELAAIILAINDPLVQTSDDWWRALDASSARGSLCWTAVQTGPHDHWYCAPEIESQLRDLRVVPSVWDDRFFTYTPTDSIRSKNGKVARTVVKHRLPVVSGWLWLGISRKGFGPELPPPSSPWRDFILGLAAAAGTTLARIHAREQVEGLTREAMTAHTVVVASTMLHEVIGHASSLIDSLKMLEEGVESGFVRMNAEYLTLLQSLNSESSDLGHIIQSLGQARAYDEERPTSLARALNVVEGLYSTKLERRRFSFTKEIPDDLPMIDIPLFSLSYVLTNLFSNSLDAIPSSGKISLTALVKHRIVVLYFSDNGPGLPAGRDPFSAGKSTKPGGTGLGLWLSKRCLEDAGATIAVETSDRAGAHFVVQLPTAS